MGFKAQNLLTTACFYALLVMRNYKNKTETSQGNTDRSSSSCRAIFKNGLWEWQMAAMSVMPGLGPEPGHRAIAGGK